MKTIKDYIKNYRKPKKWGLWTFEEFCDINNLNESNITDEDINYFYSNRYKFLPDRINGSYTDWVNESLTSHSREKLINKLMKILGEYYISIIDVKEKDMKVGVFGIEVSKDCPIISNTTEKDCQLSHSKMSEKIYDVIQFFNYYITLVDSSQISYGLYFEPYYTERADDVVKRGGNILYHITDKKNLSKILKTGLRPKVGKTLSENGYRYFSERIYLIFHTDNVKDDISNVIVDKMYDDPVILRINLKNHNISLWYDDSSYGNTVYTLEAIPPKLIEVINIEDI